MDCYHALEAVERCRVVLAVGVFDGLHLGHRAVVAAGRRLADEKRAQLGVFTFSDHPQAMLQKSPPPRILHPEQRLSLLEEWGVDLVFCVPFDEKLRTEEPEHFVDRLRSRLDLAGIAVGSDFRFGRDRAGDVQLLRGFGTLHGFTVEVLSPVEMNGEKISATRVRALLAGGDLKAAAQCLGRPHRFRGVVVRGAGRGRSLGFPTINIHPKPEAAYPNGVYSARAALEGIPRNFMGACFLGGQPTFQNGGRGRFFEIHLIGYDGPELYGSSAAAELVEFIRPEETFESAEALSKRIHEDVRSVQLRLAGTLE